MQSVNQMYIMQEWHQGEGLQRNGREVRIDNNNSRTEVKVTVSYIEEEALRLGIVAWRERCQGQG